VPVSRLLDGKVALVTGSAIGLGAAIAAVLAREGARLVITGMPEDRGRALAATLGGGSCFIPADFRDVEATKRLAAETLAACGGLDILVNNAAVNVRATLDTFTAEQFDDMMHVNVRAPLLLAQAFLPSLVERTGAIVNIGSVNAHVGWQNLLVYAASKAALVGASRNMANALKYARVRVHCINPGWVDTEGERAAMRRLGHPDDFLDREGTALPMGRLIAPEEIAEAVLFFVSEKSAAFSGTVIDLEQYPLGCLHHPKHSEPMQ
jgi:NAD(P)-dependent dehydrogenase (short-subunit alcohol dehydrogenase family)